MEPDEYKIAVFFFVAGLVSGVLVSIIIDLSAR